MSEIWKTPDGKRRFRVPDGAELYQGPFTIIDSEEQYQMNVREEDILPFEIEAAQAPLPLFLRVSPLSERA